MMVANLDRCEREKILSPLLKLSQVFDKNKDDIIFIFRRTREHGKDHSMKRCEQRLGMNGTAKSGKPIGRKLPLHHLHNNGGNTNTNTLNGANTTLNGEITIGGKSDGYRVFQSHMGFLHRFRVHTSAIVVFATWRSQCCQCRAPLTFTRTCVWLETCLGRVAHLCILKCHPLTACFIDHSST